MTIITSLSLESALERIRANDSHLRCVSLLQHSRELCPWYAPLHWWAFHCGEDYQCALTSLTKTEFFSKKKRGLNCLFNPHATCWIYLEELVGALCASLHPDTFVFWLHVSRRSIDGKRGVFSTDNKRAAWCIEWKTKNDQNGSVSESGAFKGLCLWLLKFIPQFQQGT